MAISPQSLCFLTLGELSALIDRREVTSVEATRAVLDRIDKLNPMLRAYLAHRLGPEEPFNDFVKRHPTEQFKAWFEQGAT